MRIAVITFSAILLLLACKSDPGKGNKNKKSSAEITTPADTIPDSTEIKTAVTQPDDKKTTIYFPKDNYNFGQITEGDVVSHIFSFTNSGDETLIIKAARGSCGCTVPEYSKKPISPGAKGEIKVTFDSHGKSGPNTKGVFIEANTDPELTILKITTEVMPKNNGKVQPTKEEKEKIKSQQTEQM